MKILRTKQFASPSAVVEKAKEAMVQGKRNLVPAHLLAKERIPAGYSTRLRRMAIEAKKAAGK